MTEKELSEVIKRHKAARKTCYFAESLRRVAIEVEELYGLEMAMPLIEVQTKMERLYRGQEAEIQKKAAQ